MNQSAGSLVRTLVQKATSWGKLHVRQIFVGIIGFVLLVISISLVYKGGSDWLWLLLTIPLTGLFLYFSVLPQDLRLKFQDWLVDYAFPITAVLSAWIIAVLLLLWVIVALVWAPRDALLIGATVANTPRITVSHPHTILADGESVNVLVTISNETAVSQTAVLTITKSDNHPILFIENPDAAFIIKTWTISPTSEVTGVVGLINDGTETAVVRKPISLAYDTPTSDTINTTIIAEGIWGARLRQFVTSTVEQTSPVIILIAFLVPGLSAVLQQLIKTRKAERDKMKEEKFEELIESTRREIRLKDFQEASELLGKIKKQKSNSGQNREKTVYIIESLLKLANCDLSPVDIDDTIEKCNEWPDELVICFLAAWEQSTNQDFLNGLLKARQLLPVAQLRSEVQDKLAFLELEIVQQEKDSGVFQPVRNWPVPPKHIGIAGQSTPLPFVKNNLNGHNPYASPYAQDELYELFKGEKQPSFWGGHPLFKAMYTIDRVTLIHSPSGYGRTTFAFGFQYFSGLGEVFALHIPGKPNTLEIQQQFVQHIFDFVLTFPSYLRRTTEAETDLLAQMLVNQIGKAVVLGCIQARQAELSTKNNAELKIGNFSERLQLQLLSKRVKEAVDKDDKANWLMNGGLRTVVQAVGFEQTILVLESSEREQAQFMINDLLPQTLIWQRNGLNTIFFLPEEHLLKIPYGEYYQWDFEWSLDHFRKMLNWRYYAFIGPRRSVIEVFEDEETFQFMLKQCLERRNPDSYNPRTFIQLWHIVIKDLPDHEKITIANIEPHITTIN